MFGIFKHTDKDRNQVEEQFASLRKSKFIVLLVPGFLSLL